MIVEIQPVVLEKSDFDCGEKPLNFAFLLQSAYETANSWNIFRNMFIEWTSWHRKVSIEPSVEEMQSVVLEINELKSEEKPYA